MRDVEKFKRHMRICLGIFVVLFSILILYLGYSVIVYGERWFATPYNPRLQNAIQNIDAGTLFDVNGTPLAWTEDGQRHYHEDSSTRQAVSHIVGDTHGYTIGEMCIRDSYRYM